MNSLDSHIYLKEPLSWTGDIPVFSEMDAYSDNYKKIANDHLIEFEETGHNPFMPQDLIDDLEVTTARLIDKYLPDSGDVLDVGVGMGGLFSRLNGRSDAKKYGIDISIDYLKKSKEKGIEVSFARVEDLPYQHSVFDLIVTTDVLEHVLDLNLCSRRILSSLKVGGVLIVRVPYSEPLTPYLDPSLPYDLVHLRSFDESGIRLFYEKIFGCEFIESSFSGFLPLPNRFKPGFGSSAAMREGIIAHAEQLRESSSHDVCKKFMEIFFSPLEINVVFRKTDSTILSLGYPEITQSGGGGIEDLESAERGAYCARLIAEANRKDRIIQGLQCELEAANDRLNGRLQRALAFIGRNFPKWPLR